MTNNYKCDFAGYITFLASSVEDARIKASYILDGINEDAEIQYGFSLNLDIGEAILTDEPFAEEWTEPTLELPPCEKTLYVLYDRLLEAKAHEEELLKAEYGKGWTVMTRCMAGGAYELCDELLEMISGYCGGLERC